jgi:hypothetical protein
MGGHRALGVGMRFPILLVLLVLGTVAGRAAAPALDYFLPAGDHDPRVPTPAAFFGHEIGKWHLRADQVNAYLRAVAAAVPERVQVEAIGRSHARHELLLVVISSEANLARREEWRERHLAELAPSRTPPPARPGAPVIVNLGYGVHGNEPSAVNAVPLVVYHFAASLDSTVAAQRDAAILLIEPIRNPDGHDRAAQWFNGNRSIHAPSADPADREHNEGWPGGRFNHYWFDPNRDWLPLIHPEAQARAEVFHRWRPHVAGDFHEMGTNTTYFFQPGVPTRNNPSSPAGVFRLTAALAEFHRAALEEAGELFFTQERFDDFYPGKGSTYPDLHGSVGILFEQASARGHAQESENGVVTLARATRNQVLTSLSTVAGVVAHREELLAQHRGFTRDALAAAQAAPVQAYVLGDDGDPARAAELLRVLAAHRVRVHGLAAPLEAEGQRFEPGRAWVVPVAQPQYRLVTEIFTRRTTFEDSIFYDVSAWSLPLAWNLPQVALARVPAMTPAPVEPPAPAGRLVGGTSRYAYVLDWADYHAPRALHRFQRAGLLVKGLTGRPVTVEAADGSMGTFGPGAILIPVVLQPARAAEIEALVRQAVAEDAVTIYAVDRGLARAGVDLGSSSWVVLPRPEVALITGPGVDARDIGAAWHLLDQRVHLTPTLLEHADLPRRDLGRYQVIVMAEGRYGALSDAVVAKLQAWTRAGGTLVLMGRAVEWAVEKKLAPLTLAGRPVREGPVERQAYGEAADREALQTIAGAIVEARLDLTHPLAYGFARETLPLLRKNTLFLEPAASPYATPAVYAAEPLLAGYISGENQARLAGSAAAVALPQGAGLVVALPDDPNFRGFWFGGNRLFLNAVFFGGAVRDWGAGEDEGAQD